MHLCTYLTAPKCVLRLLKFLATAADGTLKSPPLYIPPYHMCVCVRNQCVVCDRAASSSRRLESAFVFFVIETLK